MLFNIFVPQAKTSTTASAIPRLFNIRTVQVAIALTLLALSMLMLWEENYGYGEEAQSTPSAATKDGNGKLGRKEAPASTTADAAVSSGGGGAHNAAAATAAAPGTGSITSALPASSRNGAEPHGNGAGTSSNGELCCNGDGRGFDVGGGGDGGAAPGWRKSVSMAWGCIVSDPRVLLLGMVQSLFEGGTFTFGEKECCGGRKFLLLMFRY